MSALLDRIRFLVANPEVGVQHFSVEEAKEFMAWYNNMLHELAEVREDMKQWKATS